jgi:GNAT superfamily N-acetyltransferase
MIDDRVHLAALDDVEAMYGLIQETLDHDFDTFSDAAKASHKATWSRDALRTQINSTNKLSLTMRSGGDLQGVVIGNAPEGGVATIIWLLVRRPFQSQGAGAALFRSACQIYKDRGAHKVKLTASNKRARDFYVSQGMQEEGFHPKHWWKTDFWVLGKILDDS